MGAYDINGNPIALTSIYLNVRDFGAKGDGSTDDYAAIQSALDSVKTTGGTIFFPKGAYITNSTLRFYSNQHLLFDADSILKTGNSSLDALLLGYVGDTVGGYNGIENIIIDGGNFQRGARGGAMTLVAVSHAKNVIFVNCKFGSTGAWHNLEINGSKHCKITNCYFEGSTKTGTSGCLLQLDSMSSYNNFPWDHVGLVDSTKCNDIEIDGCWFENCSTTPFIGSHSNSGSNVRIHSCAFDNNTSNRGAIQFDTLLNLDVYNNTFTNCTNGISFSGTGASSCAVHDNRFTDATTAISSAIAAQYNNWINGSFAASNGSE